MNDLKVKSVKYTIHPAGEDTTAFIAALPTRLTKQKKRQWSDHYLIFLLRQSSRQDHSESCPTDYFRLKAGNSGLSRIICGGVITNNDQLKCVILCSNFLLQMTYTKVSAVPASPCQLITPKDKMRPKQTFRYRLPIRYLDYRVFQADYIH